MTISKTAFLRASGELIFEENELIFDPVGSRKFLAKTLFTAISPGTELAAWKGLPHLREGVGYPRLVGYCNISEVLSVGQYCENISIGDIVLTNSSHCSHFIKSKDDFVFVLPKNSNFEKFVTAYLFHLGYSAVLAAGESAGTPAAIIGMGVLGIPSACMSTISGWNVTGISNQRNLDYVTNKLPNFKLKSREDKDNEGKYKVVIVTTNSWADWDMALRLAGNRGKLLVLGFPGRGYKKIPFNPLRSNDFYVKQLKIIAAGNCAKEIDERGFNFFNEKDNIKRILNWIIEGTIDTSLIKSEKKPADQLQKMYKILSDEKRDLNTFILDWTK